jgi:dethiobiotin synthetase
MTTLFVTSSSTDIGKTFVCCRLLEAWRSTRRIRCIKPIITGFDPANAAATDTGRLLAAQNRSVNADNIADTSPWRFIAPLSVDMAAARENRVIPFDALLEFSLAAPGADLNLIEGIGGVMAPLDARHTVLDWIAALDAPVLLVVGSYLGALSHTLTAVQALAGRQVKLAAIVVSQSAAEPVPTAETVASLEHFCGDVPILILPRTEKADATELAALLDQCLHLRSKEPPAA